MASVKSPATKLRGAFLNTEYAICSIYESGLMVFDCLKSSNEFELIYIALNTIDLHELEANGKLSLRAGGGPASIDMRDFDFWVLNYHPATMSPYLKPEWLKHLKGPKFAIVLEVEADDPAKFVPAGLFDSCIVLDPTAKSSPYITAFPRPLGGKALQGKSFNRPVPLIGSFGLGTPGKGFEHLIEAVNLEFDEATVRINVPASTYADDPMATVHGRNYADYLKDQCLKIAKPGIVIDFTRKFFTQDELLEWCSNNDLNCFMYTRRQSGLSATTDQCILSGQPLLVSSNDTFRHIHQYIPPYPSMSLRSAMDYTIPLVQRMQRDWSVEAFEVRFLEMLKEVGLLRSTRRAERQIILGGAPSIRAKHHNELIAKRADETVQTESATPTRILIAVPTGSDLIDATSYVQRVSASLIRTGRNTIITQNYESPNQIPALVFWTDPDLVVVCDNLEANDLHQLAQSLPKSTKLIVQQTSKLDNSAFEIDSVVEIHILPRQPIIPYYTALPSLPPGGPIIALVGFGSSSNTLELVISKIQREQDNARILIGILKNANQTENESLSERLNGIPYQLSLLSSFTISMIDLTGDASSIIHALGACSLIVFADNGIDTELIQNICDLALTTERAVVFTQSAPLAPFKSGTFIENYPIPDLIGQGMKAQVSLYNEFSEGKFLASFKKRFIDELAPVVCRSAPASWPTGSIFPSPNMIVGDGDASWLRKLADLRCADIDWASSSDGNYIASQQHFLVAAVDRMCDGDRSSAIGSFGDPTRTARLALTKMGYEIESLDYDDAVPTERYDCVFDLCALPGENELNFRIGSAIRTLKIGGYAIFTFFYKDSYAADDPRENLDFPTIEPVFMQASVNRLGASVVRPEAWQVAGPISQPQPFGPAHLGTLILSRDR